MVVRATISSSKLIFLNDEKDFIEKEPVNRRKLPQTNLNISGR